MLYAVLGSAATVALHICGLGWGQAAFAALVGWPLIGTLVTADDDLPGGWTNPDGTRTPDWRRAEWWGQLAIGSSASAFVTALEDGMLTKVGVQFEFTGLAATIVAFALLRRKR
jgi:hypothetical protein